MFLEFSDIPNHQNLFLDYLYEFDNVQKYYHKNFRETSEYESTFKEITQKNNEHREILYRVIQEQYKDFKLSKQTQLNIDNLTSEKCITVLTGQQLGISGGPLYSFYKTITAIKLANSLKEKFDNYKFVPVFWLAGDDHDFEEIRSINILNKENVVQSIRYDDAKSDELNRGSVGNLKLKKGIQSFLSELRSSLRETEFSDELFVFLNSIYKEGITFKDAFRKLLFKLFDEYGLIIFDPQDIEVKKILSPLFQKEVLDYRIQSKELVEVSAELEEVYHAQVKVKPINLFVNEKDGRYLLEPVEDKFRLKGKRKTFTEEEILERIQNHPDDFSPNVLLRPVCQDYLFPTAFYVGGPSEVSYFAQAGTLYDFYKIPRPFVYPRSSLTIIEKPIQKIITKYNLNYYDIFIGKDLLNKKIIGELAEINLEDLFENSKNEIDAVMDNLREKLFAIDPTLNDSVLKTRAKVFQSFNSLKAKSEAAQKRQYNDSFRQIKKLRNFVFPLEDLQERELNFVYFANKYGLDFVKLIFNELQINKFAHQILEL